MTGPEATIEEQDCVDLVLGPPPAGWNGGGHEARAQRHLLLPVLHALQSRFGWIPPGGLRYACQRLSVPPAEGYGVASFYGLFSMTPRPPLAIQVCDDIGCAAKGAEHLCRCLEEAWGPSGSAIPGKSAMWSRSPCLGLCERAPAAIAVCSGRQPVEQVIAPVGVDSLLELLHAGELPAGQPPDRFQPAISLPQAGQGGLVLLRRVGQCDPEDLESYRAHGGYRALERALEVGPVEVIREVQASRILGRGGAAYPKGRKWEAVAKSPVKPHYLVCNADESEPGTFKDRILMEGDPFALVEAMTIAGFATGCETGYLYLRGEYSLALKRMKNAVESARRSGWLGAQILGTELRFDIEICRGAGAYICGEETALFNSIEGYRGEPRNKPPFPVESGLFGKPTAINNVETLVNILPIVLGGGAAYAATGTSGSTGSKLFCVSGHVARPGLYEVEFGHTLGELIQLAGGIGGSGRLQAVLVGGAAGTFVTPRDLGLPLTFEGTLANGTALGAGVVMLFDDTVDLHRVVLRIASFFREESCGQCVPCRVGTVRQEESLHRLVEGHPLFSRESELEILRELGQVMRDASICGLGQTAASAVESAVKRLRLFQRG